MLRMIIEDAVVEVKTVKNLNTQYSKKVEKLNNDSFFLF